MAHSQHAKDRRFDMDTHTILEQSKLTVTLNINLTQEQETNKKHTHMGVSVGFSAARPVLNIAS